MAFCWTPGSKMPPSCPVAPPSQHDASCAKTAAAVVTWRGGRAPPGPPKAKSCATSCGRSSATSFSRPSPCPSPCPSPRPSRVAQGRRGGRYACVGHGFLRWKLAMDTTMSTTFPRPRPSRRPTRPLPSPAPSPAPRRSRAVFKHSRFKNAATFLHDHTRTHTHARARAHTHTHTHSRGYRKRPPPVHAYAPAR